MKSLRFSIDCFGVDAAGKDVLEEPLLSLIMQVSKRQDSDLVCVDLLDCPYNTGGHGQRCKASHPEVDKLGEGVSCPFSMDFRVSPFLAKELDNLESLPERQAILIKLRLEFEIYKRAGIDLSLGSERERKLLAARTKDRIDTVEALRRNSFLPQRF
jgi:hypothetical protein